MENTCETKESCFQKMVARIKRSIPEIIGALIGGIGGFIYYYKVGCVSGTCAITSNPWLSVFWGTLMGYLIVGVFSTKRK